MTDTKPQRVTCASCRDNEATHEVALHNARPTGTPAPRPRRAPVCRTCLPRLKNVLLAAGHIITDRPGGVPPIVEQVNIPNAVITPIRADDGNADAKGDAGSTGNGETPTADTHASRPPPTIGDGTRRPVTHGLNGLERALAVIDTEWTDGSAELAEMVSLAVQRLEPNGTGYEVLYTVRPGRAIQPATTKVHGFTDEMVKDSPGFAHYAGQVEEDLRDADIGGYSVHTDIQIVERAFMVTDVDWRPDECRIVDAFQLWRHLEPRSLSDAHARFVGQVPGEISAHDADDDVRMTVRVLEKLVGRRTAAEIHELTSAHVLDPAGRFRLGPEGEVVIDFSKHRHQLARAEPGFLRWMLRQTFPPSTKRIAERVLRELGAQDSDDGQQQAPSPAELDYVDDDRRFVRRKDGEIILNFSTYKGSLARKYPEFLRWMTNKDFGDSTKTVARHLLKQVAEATGNELDTRAAKAQGDHGPTLWYRGANPGTTPTSDRKGTIHAGETPHETRYPAAGVLLRTEGPKPLGGEWVPASTEDAAEAFGRRHIDTLESWHAEQIEKAATDEAPAMALLALVASQELQTILKRQHPDDAPTRYRVRVNPRSAYHPLSRPRTSTTTITDGETGASVMLTALGADAPRAFGRSTTDRPRRSLPITVPGVPEAVAMLVDDVWKHRPPCPTVKALEDAAGSLRCLNKEPESRLKIYRMENGEVSTITGGEAELLELCADTFHAAPAGGPTGRPTGWVVDLINKDTHDRCQLHWPGPCRPTGPELDSPFEDLRIHEAAIALMNTVRELEQPVAPEDWPGPKAERLVRITEVQTPTEDGQP